MEVTRADSLSGQYLRTDGDKVLNLNTLTRLWQGHDGIFTKGDSRIYYKSCGEELSSPMSEEKISELFNCLADEGSFTQIGKNLINTKTLQSLRYKNGTLYFQQAGDDSYEDMAEADAQKIFDKLCEQKRFMQIGDHVINLNKAVNIWFSPGGWLSSDTLEVNFMGSSTTSIKMDEGKARQAMATILEKPQFKDIGGEIANVALAGNVWIEGDKIKMSYPGTSCSIKLDGASGQALLHLFEDRFGFQSAGEEKLNTNIASTVWTNKGGWFSSDGVRYKILDSSGGIDTDFSHATQIKSTLLGSDDFVEIDDRAYNINSIGYAHYDGKHLRFKQGTEDYTARMDEKEARGILDKIIASDKFIDIEGRAVNMAMAGEVKRNKKDISIRLGQETKEIKVSPEQAAAIIDKICKYGEEKYMDEQKRRLAAPDEDDIWSPDLLADIYEEIESAQTTNMVVMMAAITVMNANTVSVGR